MCLNPTKVPDYGYVACRKCWQCLERKIDDWVGRNIAESKTAKAAHVVTLTYGVDRQTGGIDHLRAAVLTYSDVQKMLKHLRVDGYPVRYFVTGEYGSKKGRAHWHIILYWQAAVPPIEKIRRNIHWKWWPHGWSYFDKMSPEAIRYACKYLVKVAGDEDGQIFGPMPSKKPPLGDAYFRDLAERYIEAGLSPQSLFYQFPEVRRTHRGVVAKTAREHREAAKPIAFLMTGKTAENFCKYFVEGWRERYLDEPPASEVIWRFLDKGLQAYVESITLPRFERRGFVPVPDKPPYGGTGPFPDPVLNTYYSDVDGVRLYYSYDMEGDLGWHEKIRPDPAKERARQAWLDRRERSYQIATQGA